MIRAVPRPSRMGSPQRRGKHSACRQPSPLSGENNRRSGQRAPGGPARTALRQSDGRTGLQTSKPGSERSDWAFMRAWLASYSHPLPIGSNGDSAAHFAYAFATSLPSIPRCAGIQLIVMANYLSTSSLSSSMTVLARVLPGPARPVSAYSIATVEKMM